MCSDTAAKCAQESVLKDPLQTCTKWLPPKRVLLQVYYRGLNHLSWCVRLSHRGKQAEVADSESMDPKRKEDVLAEEMSRRVSPVVQ